MREAMEESMYEKFATAQKFGVGAESFVQVQDTADANDNGNVSQSEAESAIARIPGISLRERAALWQVQNKSWKAESNPFDAATGRKVKAELGWEDNKGTSSDGGGLSLAGSEDPYSALR